MENVWCCYTLFGMNDFGWALANTNRFILMLSIISKSSKAGLFIERRKKNELCNVYTIPIELNILYALDRNV